uniref:Uncharacterized protein n=1 Tax=Oryza nivara TaxID=4536 RepID=A0A0E0IEB7_ORYNI
MAATNPARGRRVTTMATDPGRPGSRRRRRRGGTEGWRQRQKTTAVVDGVFDSKTRWRRSGPGREDNGGGVAHRGGTGGGATRRGGGGGKMRRRAGSGGAEERISGSSTWEGERGKAWNMRGAHKWLGLFAWPNLACARSTLASRMAWPGSRMQEG